MKTVERAENVYIRLARSRQVNQITKLDFWLPWWPHLFETFPSECQRYRASLITCCLNSAEIDDKGIPQAGNVYIQRSYCNEASLETDQKWSTLNRSFNYSKFCSLDLEQMANLTVHFLFIVHSVCMERRSVL